ncbi:MAG: 8-oxoguanine deaminase [Acidimicrobiaceae bacterium]|nr:8-oxoguanine deaminase [Acidimicrobiaceae bacterium]MYB87710.1 8-oxoguanine deaminase [Acidimicrobiaceae bacterium]MYH94797.1 8-oxoguanine deaminase [Acidimicrobiaceae bacterium]
MSASAPLPSSGSRTLPLGDSPLANPEGRADLCVRDAELVVTMDAYRREILGGWVAVSGGFVTAMGEPGSEPTAERTIDASGCLVTPGLINTHHHIFQNLTRAFAPALAGDLFHWLRTLYPLWSRLDSEAAYVSAWIGLAELALGGCTTSTDHLYVHPRGGGDLTSAEIEAARDLGFRFHPTRGSMSLSEKDGGLPPDSVVQDDDEILADCERLVSLHHDPAPGAMVRIALAPCSHFSVTPDLMTRTAELAERLDVRLHTHLAENADDSALCESLHGCRPIEFLESVGWGSDRSWVAHCVVPNAAEIDLLARWGTGVSHCPSCSQLIGLGVAPIREMLDAGVPVGIGCDGSASTDCASLWLETRGALLLARLRGGPEAMNAREALEMATLGGAACLGRDDIGALETGRAGDLVVWPLEGVAFAGALSDPVEALLRCGPVAPRHTVVAGKLLVEDGRLTATGVDEMLARHRRIAGEWLEAAGGD